MYLAFDPDLERSVAIKVPHSDGLTPAFRDRFLREARATATIHHPNVCPVYEVGTDGDLPFIVMHYVVGGTLAGLLERTKTPLPSRHALAIARKLALGMAAAHAQGVIHRDLKPANVLFDSTTREVLVTDFGLARVNDDGGDSPRRIVTGDQPGAVFKTAEGAVFGTPAYMAPEQARGKQDEIGPLSDVYSLGVILYRMLTGDVPFRGGVYEVMIQHVESHPAQPSTMRAELDPALDAICLRALAKSPKNRYSSAKEFAAALSDYLRSNQAGELIVGEIVTEEPMPQPKPSRVRTADDNPPPHPWRFLNNRRYQRERNEEYIRKSQELDAGLSCILVFAGFGLLAAIGILRAMLNRDW